jgi:hypothetical protein
MKTRLVFLLFVFLVCSVSSFAQQQLSVTAVNANIREIPATAGRIVGAVPRCTSLFASAASNGWYYVVTKTTRGWIHYSNVSTVTNRLPLPPPCKVSAVLPNYAIETFELLGMIKGDQASKAYYLTICPGYRRVLRRNAVFFQTKEEAERAGFRISRRCR